MKKIILLLLALMLTACGQSNPIATKTSTSHNFRDHIPNWNRPSSFSHRATPIDPGPLA